MIVFELEGERWTSSDLTLRETAEVEKATGKPYGRIQPKLWAGDALAVIAVFLGRTRSEADVIAALERVSIDDLDTIVTIPPDIAPGIPADDLPTEFSEGGVPLPVGAPATTGSSGVPADTGGPPP